jgi:TetR/AcrR family acrAB operon transcriptional repressor
VELPVSPEVAAHGLHALMAGLIHSWMLSPEVFDLMEVSQSAIRAQLAGLGLRPCVASDQFEVG